MLVVENYHKIYYQANKEKCKANFQSWYSKPRNKEKMKRYMRKYMRKRNGIKKEKFRVKE